MAKRSASKAISKLNKQISNLESKKEIEDKETIPIINKKEINKAKIKQNSVNQKNTSSTNKNIKKATPNKSGSKTSTAKKTKVKNNSSKVSESTQKMLNLEKEMRSLYDRVNDIVEDIEYEKTIIKNQDIILSDIKIKEKEPEEKSTLDNINSSVLNKILLILFIIFMILFIIFLGFAIFVSTF